MIATFVGFITFESNVARAGDTWYVGSGPGNDSATINGGIALANPGDTVYVYSGTYNEHVWIDRSINLTGENRDTTIIDGGGSGDVVYITSDWVNITGFTVRNSGRFFHPDYDAGIKLSDVKNCNIYNNVISANLNGGIHIESSSNNKIFDNSVLSNDDAGIQLRAPSSQNDIDNNYISNNHYGIKLEGVKNTNITNNLFQGDWHSIHSNGASYNNIINNSISSSAGSPIAFYGGGRNNIIGNDINGGHLGFGSVFYENFLNNKVSFASDQWSFQLYGSSYFNISGNVFSTPASGTAGGFILIRSLGDNISNNHFSNNGICIFGEELFHFNTHTIPDNNIVNGKPLYYHKNSTGVNIDGIPVGQLILANCTDFKVKNLHINNTYVGIQVAYSQNILIKNNNVSNNLNGVMLGPSSSNNITNNRLLSNSYHGFALGSCSNNNITNNTVASSYYGIYIYSSSTNNSIYHNKFINNTNQAIDDTNNGNQWDNGYPSGGNYWSDFDEPSEGAFDDYQGPNQDDPISGDGIVDNGSGAGGGKNPYVLDADSQDNYPLIAPIERLIPILNPPALYINISANGRDVILYWDPPPVQAFDPYLIYRSTDPNNFDFSKPWVNTLTDKEPGELVPIPDRTMWNDTNAAFPSNVTNYKECYYYVIRAFNLLGQVSSTSRTVGKWTKTFPQGVSTFSLPLEPLENMTIDNCLNDMNATYIKWMNQTTHTWMKHGDGSINDAQMKVGEGYEVKFDSQTNYTFTGLPGAMISYDDDSVFSGFDYATEAKNLSVSVEPNGNVTLTWDEPANMNSGDWYEVYYSNTRDGFFGTFNVSYFLVCPPVYFGNKTTTHNGALANDPGTRLYYMVVPFNASGVRGASTYSIGIWTEEYLQGYDTFGVPLKLETNQTADWYCDNILETVGINYYIYSEQRWGWHSTRMPAGAYDPMLVMTEGYQISTSNTTKFTFIGR